LLVAAWLAMISAWTAPAANATAPAMCDDLVAVLAHKKTGSQWLGLWVGRLNSQEFVNRGFTPGPTVGAQNASAHR